MAVMVHRGAIRAVVLTLALGGIATAGNVIEIEETWELTVGGPNVARSSPQVSMVMSASGDTNSDYFLVSLNHWSSPEYAPGGVQAQHWNGDNCLSVANSPDKQPLHNDGETISWAQRLTLADGELVFQVLDGQSESWGDFTSGSSLRLATPTELTQLNAYKPAVSINESGIGFAGNRVSSLVLQRIRWRFEGDNEHHEMVAPIDIDSDLDPWRSVASTPSGTRVRHPATHLCRGLHPMFAQRTCRRLGQQHRRGAVTVLAAFLSIVMLGMVAFSVDVGYILSCKEELQRTADAAAMAAAWEYASQLADGAEQAACEQAARSAAASVASGNVVGRVAPAVEANYSNSPSGDLVLGYVPDLYTRTTPDVSQPDRFNVAKVKIRRDGALNGEAPLFFAKVFGQSSQGLFAEATAGLVRNIGGFQASSGGGNIDLLPFALDRETHLDWLAGGGTDEYAYDAATGNISCGPDGKTEVNLYPQSTGSPGNRGTVDIGGSNNSTNDIARQILYGISPQDFIDLGKPLTFNQCGELDLNGDTGISAGVKDELAAIKGEPRIIPIFREVNGPGNNAIYTIVAWQGIRIMDVKLTGPMSKKHLTIQMAPVLTTGVVPTTVTSSSHMVFSPAVLLQ